MATKPAPEAEPSDFYDPDIDGVDHDNGGSK